VALVVHLALQDLVVHLELTALLVPPGLLAPLVLQDLLALLALLDPLGQREPQALQAQLVPVDLLVHQEQA
jgi:hypothetical protein